MSGPREFFNAVQGSFNRALAETKESAEFSYELCGERFAIRFVSPVLSRRLTPALNHLRVTGASRQMFRIDVWDTASSGVSPPPPPWGPDDYRQRGEIRGFNAEGIQTAFHCGTNTLSMFDKRSGQAYFWTPSAEDLPRFQDSSPFLIILNWWTTSVGMTLIHAGAVGSDRGGVLLAGMGGSGKSTSALSCLDTELSYVSDDYCLLANGDPPVAHAIYSSGKLDENSLKLLPHLRPEASNPDRKPEEKAIIFVNDVKPEALKKNMTVHAVLIPQTGAPQASLERVSAPEALKALAPSSIFQLTGAGQTALSQMSLLVRRIPAYRLHLGSSMKEVPGVISSLIRKLAP